MHETMPGERIVLSSVAPAVLEFVFKSELPRIAVEADEDPEAAILSLSSILARLTRELVVNPAAAAPFCPGMTVPEVDSRVSAVYRNDIAVVKEVVFAMLASIGDYFGDKIHKGLPKSADELQTRVTDAYAWGRRSAAWPFRNVTKPTVVVVPEDLAARVAEIIGTPIDNEEGTMYCRRNLLAKGGDTNYDVWLLMLGRIMAWESHLWVTQYSYTATMFGNAAEQFQADRLARIITAAASVCTFERKRDLFLSEILRTKLNAERLVLLAWGEAPMRAIPAQYGTGEETNNVVRPFIDVPLSERATGILYRSDRRIDSFVFSIAIVQELVDMDDIRIFTNTEIPFSESDPVAQPFVVCSNFVGLPTGFGIVENRCLSSCDDTSDFPICAVILDLVRRRIRSPLPGTNVKSYINLLQCCEDLHPPASNVFLKYLKVT
jgi:hypothetical protein